jgi:hypothetical protein
VHQHVHPDAARDDVRTIGSSRLFFLALFISLAAGAGAVAIAVAHLAGRTQPSAAATAAGCLQTRSPYGYPDRYFTEPYQYTKHPPRPVSRWRGPDEFVRFNLLFHAVFHGFVVVEYRPDMSPRTLERLRSWVLRHARDRVTSAPARADAPFAVDVAKWGYELRCTTEAAVTTVKLDRFLALRSRP